MAFPHFAPVLMILPNAWIKGTPDSTFHPAEHWSEIEAWQEVGASLPVALARMARFNGVKPSHANLRVCLLWIPSDCTLMAALWQFRSHGIRVEDLYEGSNGESLDPANRLAIALLGEAVRREDDAPNHPEIAELGIAATLAYLCAERTDNDVVSRLSAAMAGEIDATRLPLWPSQVTPELLRQGFDLTGSGVSVTMGDTFRYDS